MNVNGRFPGGGVGFTEYASEGMGLAGNGVSMVGNISVDYFDPFSSVSDNAALSFGIVDNVRVEVVPEPGTIALGVLGLAGLIAWSQLRA